MSRYIDADKFAMHLADYQYSIPYGCIDESAEDMGAYMAVGECLKAIDEQPTINIVRCKNCRKSHIGGKTTHYLWCTEWGRSTDTFGYCERGEREGE